MVYFRRSARWPDPRWELSRALPRSEFVLTMQSRYCAHRIPELRLVLRIITARVMDVVAMIMGSAGRSKCEQYPTENVKQGYPRSQLTFRKMTRKTQDVPYCKLFAGE